MTEYELATLAARHAGIWIAAADVVVGLMQCGIVAYGIRAMQIAGDRRAEEQDQRHKEAMAAIDAQNRSLDAQIRALDAQIRRFDAQNRSLDAQTRALETLIARNSSASA